MKALTGSPVGGGAVHFVWHDLLQIMLTSVPVFLFPAVSNLSQVLPFHFIKCRMYILRQDEIAHKQWS